jgi:hypothetical protein
MRYLKSIGEHHDQTDKPAGLDKTGSSRLSILHAMNKALLAFIAALWISVSAVAENTPLPPVRPYLDAQTLVRLPDGRHYNFVCMGSGAPVAILDAGLNQWSYSWRTIHPEFAKLTRVCGCLRTVIPNRLQVSS